MIKIILPNDSIEVTEPHYILKFNYSIGGETSDIITKTRKLSLNNPYIERAVYLLNNFLTDKELTLISLRDNSLSVKKLFNRYRINSNFS